MSVPTEVVFLETRDDEWILPQYKTSQALKLLGMVVCAFCGNKLSVDYQYCYKCGRDVKKFTRYEK